MSRVGEGLDGIGRFGRRSRNDDEDLVGLTDGLACPVAERFTRHIDDQFVVEFDGIEPVAHRRVVEFALGEFALQVALIRADEARLQEILYNLLDNAVKYSREHGEIRLMARHRDEEIVLSISDNGIGIGKEDLPRIFERFYRVDKARSTESIRGTGLGLAIVKHVAQLHGGRVEAESEISKGTTIRVILPVKM